MNVSPNTLAKNKNFKKLRQGLIDEKALVRTTITGKNVFWKTLLPF